MHSLSIRPGIRTRGSTNANVSSVSVPRNGKEALRSMALDVMVASISGDFVYLWL